MGKVLTLKEAAKQLKSTDGAVWRMAKAGILPGRKIGNSWRFSESAILDFLAGKNLEHGAKNLQPKSQASA